MKSLLVFLAISIASAACGLQDAKPRSQAPAVPGKAGVGAGHKVDVDEMSSSNTRHIGPFPSFPSPPNPNPNGTCQPVWSTCAAVVNNCTNGTIPYCSGPSAAPRLGATCTCTPQCVGGCGTLGTDCTTGTGAAGICQPQSGSTYGACQCVTLTNTCINFGNGIICPGDSAPNPCNNRGVDNYGIGVPGPLTLKACEDAGAAACDRVTLCNGGSMQTAPPCENNGGGGTPAVCPAK